MGESQNGQSTVWVFTLNNYTDDDQERLRSTIAQGTVRYLIYGREVGASGTPHLQGFVQFTSRKRLRGAKDIIGTRCHCQPARRVDHAIEYCKKDGDWEEHGTLVRHGQRCDFERFMADVRNGNTDVVALRATHFKLFARYRQFCIDFINDQIGVPPPTVTFPLYEWQQQLGEVLKLPAHPREVMFFVDRRGNNGKSWFARYWASLYEHVQILRPGKTADMAYILQPKTRILFMDVPRSRSDVLQYDFLEMVKDGVVSSPKYDSKVKYLDACHVCVFMNEDPDMTKLSNDRYNVTTI